jgi:DNA polymerase
MGEQELVLDALTVDDALRLLGATARQPSTTTRGGEAAAPNDPRDWRAMMRDASPTAGAPAGMENAIADPLERHHAIPPDVEHAPARIPDPAARSATMGSLDDVPTGLVVGSAASHRTGEGAPWASLDEIARAVASCTLCPLHATAKNPVPGTGNPRARLVCVGEAPGANEDEQGVPFVGQAGQLLTKILAAIQLSRDDVFICNVLKHRPPGNRNPLPEEVKACSPYLVRQVELLQPKVILALGTFAAQTLLQTRESIGKLRGKIHRYHGVPLIATYHPAALLRNPSWKRPTWEDVQLARRLIDRTSDA